MEVDFFGDARPSAGGGLLLSVFITSILKYWPSIEIGTVLPPNFAISRFSRICFSFLAFKYAIIVLRSTSGPVAFLINGCYGKVIIAQHVKCSVPSTAQSRKVARVAAFANKGLQNPVLPDSICSVRKMSVEV